MMSPLSDRVKLIAGLGAALAALVGMSVFAIASGQTSARYHGPNACPLVSTEDLTRLGNPPGYTLLLGKGLEADLERTWTETQHYGRDNRERRQVTRSQKVGQKCTWIWVPSSGRTEDRQTSLLVAVTDQASVGDSWRSRPALSGESERIEGLDVWERQAAGWRWKGLLGTGSGSTMVVNCTVSQNIGPRFLQLTWSVRADDVDCLDTVAVAKNAGDRLAETGRATTTTPVAAAP